MGARSGSNYLSSLKKLGTEIWLGGERVTEVNSHPAFRNCARSIASLYDLQLERVEQMTFRTDDGGRSGLSFIQPKSIEELGKRSRMMSAWANFSGGMLDRTPDYANVMLAAMASARDFFAASDPRYGDNIASYYLEARKFDWCTTVSFINRGVHSMGETSAGIRINGEGGLALLAPFAEELLVLPSANSPEESNALAFAVPCSSKGLKFVYRGAIEATGSRFDATQCDVVFADVLVPWQRVFTYGDIARCNTLLDETGARAHLMHQVVIKNVVHAEFLLGLAARMAELHGILDRPSVTAQLAEMVAIANTMREELHRAEAGATSNRWGLLVAARPPLERALGIFAKGHPRMLEIVRSVVADLDHTSKVDANELAALTRAAAEAGDGAFIDHEVIPGNDRAPELSPIAALQFDVADFAPFTQRVKDFLGRRS